MTIHETTKAALDTLGLPTAADLMLTASSADLPDTFLVYTLIADPPELHADNVEQLRSYDVQVSIYSRTGMNALPAQIETAMLAAGFTRLGGLSLPYNFETRHFGMAMDFNFLED